MLVCSRLSKRLHYKYFYFYYENTRNSSTISVFLTLICCLVNHSYVAEYAFLPVGGSAPVIGDSGNVLFRACGDIL